jgi:hypothetical protein
MNNLIKMTYALSVAFSQALVVFAQTRADQKAVEEMTDKEMKQLMQRTSKTPIGFTSSVE